jgi:YjjG family noncanonical pyrimidine nucleotidase
MKSYQLLLFDIDNTLIDYEKTEIKALKAVYRSFFSNFCAFDQMIREFNNINSHCWQKYRQGSIDIQELRLRRFNELTLRFNIKAAPNTIASTYEKVLGEKVYPYQDSKPFLSWAIKTYKLAVVSDGIAAVQRKKLKKTGFENFFSAIILSEEIGFQKPHKKIFQAALKKLNHKNHQSLMIGDSIDGDLVGASNADIDFCWLNRKEESLPKKISKPVIVAKNFIELQHFLDCH